MTATVVSMINLKGGVGKSTLAMMLGEFAAHSLNKRDGREIKGVAGVVRKSPHSPFTQYNFSVAFI